MKNYIPYPFFPDDMPIDISYLFESEKPAGKHGFLGIDGRDFVFEDGTKVKFWGVNVNGAACFPEHDYAKIFARRLAKMGINLVRFHQLDSEWHTPNIFGVVKGKRPTNGHLDPVCMEKLDYLVHCLEEEGIYLYLDMITYRKFRSDEGVENAHGLKDSAKPVSIFNRRLIELQKEFCDEIWNHYNPYTKKKYCDDPAFVLTEITNECDMFTNFSAAALVEPYKTELLGLLDAWFKKNGIDRRAADVDLDSKTDLDFIDFRVELQKSFFSEMTDYMRSIGVKIPITGTNWGTPFPGNYLAHLDCDFLDMHPYFYDWRWGEFEKRCMNTGISQKNGTYITVSATMTHENKPTYASEWDMPWPNERRAESVLYSAALGLYQGWSGWAIHTYSYTTRLDDVKILGSEVSAPKIGNVPYRQGVFATWNDPAKIGLFYHAALMTRRNEVKEGKNFYKLTVTDRTAWDMDKLTRGPERYKLAIDMEGTSDLPELPEISPESTEAISDTDEMYKDYKKELGYIDTDMTKCVYGSLLKNGTVALNGMKVTCNNDYAVIAMSSLTDKPLCETDNILLTTIGRAENTNAKFVGELMTDIGEAPVIIESIEATVELETSQSDMSVWAISAEGYYIGTVPTEYKDGKLTFRVGETSRSMYYLIVKS